MGDAIHSSFNLENQVFLAVNNEMRRNHIYCISFLMFLMLQFSVVAIYLLMVLDQRQSFIYH